MAQDDVEAVDLQPISPEAIARTLANASGRAITADTVKADVAAGAPVNEAGLMRLDAYAAWLAKNAKGHNGRK